MMDLIAAERRALADVLGGLSTDQWHAPSLCAGWTVAHVAAHLTMPFRISADEFAAGMQQARGQFTEFSDAIAERDSGLPQADLVAALRDNAENPWSPPGGGLAGALSHDVIHGLDITWPLGVDRQAAVPAMITVLDLIVGPGDRTLFGFPLDGLELRASDLDWSFGRGAALRGRGRDLLPLLAGRPIPGEAFSGAGTQRLGAGAR
jgi:uncharacterized protein (TIGR03083 family)